MIIFLSFIIAFISLWVFIGIYISAPVYKGPISDHFDGKKFVNPTGIKAKGLTDVLTWVINREKGLWWKEHKSNKCTLPPQSVDEGEILVTFINHTTFLIQVDGINILTDPVWSERVSPFSFMGPQRMRPPAVKLEELPPIDIILLSHNHYDHLDINTLKKLWQLHEPTIYTTLGVSKYLSKHKLEKCIEMDWWNEQSIENQDSISIACVPAQHFSGRGLFDRDRTLWGGFIIKRKHGNIYFAGDTGYGNFFKEIGENFSPIKLSLIPIGAYKPTWFMSPIHVSPKEAAQIHLDTYTQTSIASHFGTFPLADDGKEEPIEALETAKIELGIKKHEFVVLKEGQCQSF